MCLLTEPKVIERKISWPTRRYYHFIAYVSLVELVRNHEHKPNMMKRNVAILYIQSEMNSSANEIRCIGAVLVPTRHRKRFYMGTLKHFSDYKCTRMYM